VHFQPPLSGALHVARTNAFFMGGGKALVNAYYRSAEALGVQIRYDTPVDAIELDGRASSPPAADRSASRPAAACWRPAASSPTANGCARPGARTSAANGRPTTS
jgi:tricarballylate dehydrogenase